MFASRFPVSFRCVSMNWKSEGVCWAAPVGGCGGPITGEHVVTEALLTKRILVEYAGAIRGDERVAVPLRKLKANILCLKHNCELGRTADIAATRLLRALRAMSVRWSSEDLMFSGLPWTDAYRVSIMVDGCARPTAT